MASDVPDLGKWLDDNGSAPTGGAHKALTVVSGGKTGILTSLGYLLADVLDLEIVGNEPKAGEGAWRWQTSWGERLLLMNASPKMLTNSAGEPRALLRLRGNLRMVVYARKETAKMAVLHMALVDAGRVADSFLKDVFRSASRFEQFANMVSCTTCMKAETQLAGAGIGGGDGEWLPYTKKELPNAS